MRYIANHDFHIHSTVSPCCHDENQTSERIFQYAIDNGFDKICLTNHLWDEMVESKAQWHEKQKFSCLTSVLPLPQNENVSFLFGAEVDMDFDNVVGISEKRYDALDFIIVSTTHLHLTGNTVRTKIQTPEDAARLWLERLNSLLQKDLPWHKTGVAHLTCGHIFKNQTPEVIKLLPEEELYSLFEKCAEKGLGIELNMKTIFTSQEEKEIMLRPYYIAKDCCCKFYLGSDSHKVEAFKTAKGNFENIITLLDLKEKDKFELCK